MADSDKLFDAAPEADDLFEGASVFDEKPTISKGESALRGAGQGVTFSLADELSAAAQVAPDVLRKISPGAEALAGLAGLGPSPVEATSQATGQNFTQSLLDEYRKLRDIERAKNEAAQAANPKSFMAGELGGGLITGTGLSKAGLMAGQGLMKAPVALDRMKGAALMGGEAGALYGAGESEADLTQGELGQFASDVGASTAIGTLAGPAVQAVPEGFGMLKSMAKKAKGTIEKTKTGKEFSRAFELGRRGKEIVSDKSAEGFTKRINKEAQKVTNFLLDRIDDNYQKKIELLKGKQVDMTEILQQAEKEVDDAVASFSLDPDIAAQLKETIQYNLYKKLPGRLEKTVTKTTSPSKETGLLKTNKKVKVGGKDMDLEELQALTKEVDESQMLPKAASMEVSPSGIKEIEKTISEGVERGAIPAEEAANMVRNLQNAAFEQRIAEPGKAKVMKGLARQASEQIKREVPETAPLTENISKSLSTLEEIGEPELKRALGEKQASAQSRNMIEDFLNVDDPNKLQKKENVLRLLEQIDPEYTRRFKARAEKVALDKGLVGATSKEGLTLPGQLLGSVKAGALKAANVAGMATKKVSKMVNWPENKLNQVAQQLRKSNNQKAQDLAGILESVSASGPDKRAARMFAISQNKEYRDLIGNITGLDDEEIDPDKQFEQGVPQ